MQIYRVDVNQSEPEPFMMISSFRSRVTATKSEFFISQEKANAKAQELRDGIRALAGHTSALTVSVSTIDVIE